MTKLLTAVAAAAMMFGATAAYSQDKTANMYTTGEGEEMMVMGGDMADGARILGDDTYAVPADCPEGSFYRSAENELTACGEGGAAFELAAPESGAMMSDNTPYPTGAMMMRPRESGEQKQN